MSESIRLTAQDRAFLAAFGSGKTLNGARLMRILSGTPNWSVAAINVQRRKLIGSGILEQIGRAPFYSYQLTLAGRAALGLKA